MDKKTSLYIEEFLNFMDDAESALSSAEESVHEADQQTQDILHYYELTEDPYLVQTRIMKLMPDIRKRRRVAKNTYEVLYPIVTWYENNRKTISCLQQLLGEVRKVERKQASRMYMDRTDIVDKTIHRKEEII